MVIFIFSYFRMKCSSSMVISTIFLVKMYSIILRFQICYQWELRGVFGKKTTFKIIRDMNIFEFQNLNQGFFYHKKEDEKKAFTRVFLKNHQKKSRGIRRLRNTLKRFLNSLFLKICNFFRRLAEIPILALFAMRSPC